MKKIIILSLILLVSNSVFSMELVNGYRYVTPAEVKIGKDSTNKLYYFDQLAKWEQDIFLKNPKGDTKYINGKLHFNMDIIERDVNNRGYGIITCNTDNCRQEDAWYKQNSSYTTYEESGIKRDNNLHRYNIFDR